VPGLLFVERAAAGEPDGLLVLHHGRGSDEQDLLGLADLLDPGRRLHVISPRAPLRLPGSPGFHWYAVPRVGYPEPVTFHDAYRQLAEFHDQQLARLGVDPSRLALGGFSMGCVMSYATGLGSDRPLPAGILGFSGFVPVVNGWSPSLTDRQGLPVFIAHGAQDPVIGIEFARRARQQLESGRLAVEYHEHPLGHQIERASLQAATEWIARTLPAQRPKGV
jgi:phospholipase/carboxylesterase